MGQKLPNFDRSQLAKLRRAHWAHKHACDIRQETGLELDEAIKLGHLISSFKLTTEQAMERARELVK